MHRFSNSSFTRRGNGYSFRKTMGLRLVIASGTVYLKRRILANHGVWINNSNQKSISTIELMKKTNSKSDRRLLIFSSIWSCETGFFSFFGKHFHIWKTLSYLEKWCFQQQMKSAYFIKWSTPRNFPTIFRFEMCWLHNDFILRSAFIHQIQTHVLGGRWGRRFQQQSLFP